MRTVELQVAATNTPLGNVPALVIPAASGLHIWPGAGATDAWPLSCYADGERSLAFRVTGPGTVQTNQRWQQLIATGPLMTIGDTWQITLLEPGEDAAVMDASSPRRELLQWVPPLVNGFSPEVPTEHLAELVGTADDVQFSGGASTKVELFLELLTGKVVWAKLGFGNVNNWRVRSSGVVSTLAAGSTWGLTTSSGYPYPPVSSARLAVDHINGASGAVIGVCRILGRA